ncbi:MAG TPA: indole-3-glycerol phosphate synthase TrpC [Gemmatimonadales bacterium]|nr:indole-3-glycerol phosphate synthase TrpC [Gemmatimonadales bacterium]
MTTTLDRILASTRATLPALRARRAELERRAATAPDPPSLAKALVGERVALIAEVKRRSPSKGTIRAELDPAAHAEAYARHGAAAISVLTDGPFFGGSLDDLARVASRVAVPVLRKDFILDEAQVLEARAAGAAAVLLIARALPAARLAELLRFAGGCGLAALVEAHDERELETALESGAEIVGVNARNLDDFRVDVAAAWELLRRIPASRIAVAESGMATPADVAAAARAGADAVLVGTALSAAPEPGELVRALASVPRAGR